MTYTVQVRLSDVRQVEIELERDGTEADIAVAAYAKAKKEFGEHEEFEMVDFGLERD